MPRRLSSEAKLEDANRAFGSDGTGPEQAPELPSFLYRWKGIDYGHTCWRCEVEGAFGKLWVCFFAGEGEPCFGAICFLDEDAKD